jgi:3-demethoxyubiquinol 3-hydroxylase
MQKLQSPELQLQALTNHLEEKLRSDHAGETGAVYIYKGILSVIKLRKSLKLQEFATHHLATEEKHLELIETYLPPKDRSRLLFAWRVAGWLTGALPALFGEQATFATIAAVETFVQEHYQQQIDHLKGQSEFAELLEVLERCQSDEILHKEEAQSLLMSPPSWLLNAWCQVVSVGSRSAVTLARVL